MFSLVDELKGMGMWQPDVSNNFTNTLGKQFLKLSVQIDFFLKKLVDSF